MDAPKTTRSRRAAFTLVELMVAMTAGIITIAGAQYMSGSAARNIADQMRLSDTQTALRSAMEQVRRDFARAGYLATRNSMDLQPMVCGSPVEDNVSAAIPTQLAAARVEVDASYGELSVISLLNRATNLRRADRVTLTGAYAAGTMFPVSSVSPGADNIVALEPTSTTFRMVFFDAPSDGSAPVYQPTRFNEVFAIGRALRFESDGRLFFRAITGTTANTDPPTVTLDSNLPSEICAPRDRSFVAPVSRIEYQVVDPALPAENITNLVPPTPSQADGAQRAVLVRRERDFLTEAVMAQSESVVLDNVVEFEVNGIINTAGIGAMPAFQLADDTSGPTIGDVTLDQTALPHGSGPEQLRSLIVTLSARSTEGDRTRSGIVSARPLPMLSFVGVNTAAAGGTFVSRVRTMRGEIFLPNTVNR